MLELEDTGAGAKDLSQQAQIDNAENFNAAEAPQSSEMGRTGTTKVQFVLQPPSAPLVPSICSPIFAKRSWRLWAQELENV